MIGKKFKIALFSTPRVAVPPPKYGGTELIVYNLAESLVKKGHDVTVFATGDSHTSAKLEYICKKSGYQMGLPPDKAPALLHCSYLFAKMKEQKFDIIHNHYGAWGLAFASLLSTPIVTTYHGDFAADLRPEDFKYFVQLAGQTGFVSISHSQARNTPFKINWVGNVYNGIDISKFDFKDKPKNYFAWMGRFAPSKGAKEAILAARQAKVKLILAGRLSSFHPEEVSYFNQEIKPLLDSRLVKYIGEINHQKKVKLLKNAIGLLNPINWNEPFGLVMTESFACGTPVIANQCGSVPEIVIDGETGFIAKTQKDIVKAIQNINEIDRRKCRARAEKYFSADKMTVEYEKIYRQILKS
ncbi:MAG: glycosyltransferase family 4 protein [Patescibacteria group bacterium]